MNYLQLWDYIVKESGHSIDYWQTHFIWECIENKTMAEDFLRKIIDVFSNFPFGNRADHTWDRLFLIGCAIICRYHKTSWQDVVYNDYVKELFPKKEIRNPTSLCEQAIRDAKVVFRRTSLAEAGYQQYVSRVFVEAGIPLRIFEDSNSSMVLWMKRIWNQMDMPKLELEQWIKRSSGQTLNGRNVFPGGRGAGPQFAKFAKRLFEDLQNKNPDENEEVYSRLLSEKGFVNTQSFAAYLSGKQGAALQVIPWRALRYSRILDLDRNRVYIECRVKKNLNHTGNELSFRVEIGEVESYHFQFRTTGAIMNDPQGFYETDQWFVKNYSNPFVNIKASARMTLDTNTSLMEEKVYLDNLNESETWIFKKYRHDDTNKWVLVDENDIHEADFPIIVSVPANSDEFRELRNYKITSFSQNEFSASRDFFKFDSAIEYTDAGFSLEEIIWQPLEQNIKAYYDGSRISKVSAGVPYTHVDNLWQRTPDGPWLKFDSHSVDNSAIVVKELLSCNQNPTIQRACKYVIMPKDFSYRFSHIAGFWSLTGFNSFNGNLLIQSTDGELISSGSTQNLELKHEDVICYETLVNGFPLHLYIPSPVVGISFRSTFDYKVIKENESIAVSDLDHICLYSVEKGDDNREHSVTWKFELFIDETRTAVNQIQPQKFKFSSFKGGCGQYYVESMIPKFPVNKLFSSTNHLKARVRISAKIDEASDIHMDVTRFKKMPNDYNAFFCFGLLNPTTNKKNFQQLPTEPELAQDIWVKVPVDDPEYLTWNHIHSPQILNNEISEQAHARLTDFQKQLIEGQTAGHYIAVQNQLAQYFKKHIADEDCIDVILQYFELCLEHDIPLCNLWLLQFVLQNDFILCKVLKRNKEVSEENGRTAIIDNPKFAQRSNIDFAFDWRFIQKNVVQKFVSGPIATSICQRIDSAFGESEDEYYNYLGKMEFYGDGISSEEEALNFIKNEIVGSEQDISSENKKRALIYLRQLEIYAAGVVQKFISEDKNKKETDIRIQRFKEGYQNGNGTKPVAESYILANTAQLSFDDCYKAGYELAKNEKYLDEKKCLAEKKLLEEKEKKEENRLSDIANGKIDEPKDLSLEDKKIIWNLVFQHAGVPQDKIPRFPPRLICAYGIVKEAKKKLSELQ